MFSGWMNNTAINWASFSNSNVCAVDWSRLANYAYSICVKRHVQMVANALIRFIAFLMRIGMNIRAVTIAGHSLGAQIASFVGKFFDGIIAAIYGIFSSMIFLLSSCDRYVYNIRHTAFYLQD